MSINTKCLIPRRRIVHIGGVLIYGRRESEKVKNTESVLESIQ